jgi:2-keto-4-pentenoate hydratase/2-oxohepta-3-ene-1,7-dioic acid hydratase in catechol pathway
MKFALFNDYELGLVDGERIYDIGKQLFVHDPAIAFKCKMVELIKNYESLKARINEVKSISEIYRVSDVRLRQPVSKPGKLIAAPVNYVLHQQEMYQEFTVEKLGFFLKATTSIIGPGETVMLPYRDRRTDHELEFAFVISKNAKNVKAEDAYNYVFGYTGLMDITVRGNEERCLRKSFDTFTPMGPWIVTKEEIDNPDDVNMHLTVNGEIRQKANTKDLISNVAKLIEVYSHVMTLEPGDIITTGTPEGVGPITEGDKVRMEIDRIGAFEVNVKYC